MPADAGPTGAGRAGSTARARRARRGGSAALVGALVALAAATACGESEPRGDVLVVVNGESPASRAIGDAYAAARRIREENVLALEVPLRDPGLGDRRDERIARADFEERVRDPVAAWLARDDRARRVSVIVLAKGVPLRVKGRRTPLEELLREADGASVDAELALLGSGLDGEAGVAGSVNPYFDAPIPFREFRRRHPDAPLRYLVARLDGYAEPADPGTGIPEDVQALIDRAVAPDEGGAERWLVDGHPDLPRGRDAGDRLMLTAAAKALSALGVPVEHDRAPRFVSGAEGLRGYASWGSNDASTPGSPFYGLIEGALYPGRFRPRSVAVDLVSTNARTFVGPPKYGQSLVADLVRHGVGGAAGHVSEPTLSGVARPDVLLRHLARGVPAGEAFYRSVPYLGWQNVYVGDPLMTVPRPRTDDGGDRDADGVPDDEDNCLALPNPDQRDTNGDGFGNLCDPDVDGDGVVTTSWGAALPVHARGDLEWIALAMRAEQADPDMDLDGDGRVTAADLSVASLFLFLPPGPSGRAEAPPPGAAGRRGGP